MQNYTGAGGKLAYLGGNGFYWRIARTQTMPHVIELRRAEGGIRAWAAEPGEYYHALDGEFGGLWRRNRRPPQMLAGVGFSGQGLFEGTHYRRLPASRDPAHAWIFEGIEEEIIGDYGLSGGGAAGFEMDRADKALGTPENAVILARSEDPPASFVTVPEELLSHLHTVSGEPPNELKRAEIVYFDTPSGGAVFSVGSITFCGSLWRDGFEGPVSRLLENVVRRFSAAKAQTRRSGEKAWQGGRASPSWRVTNRISEVVMPAIVKSLSSTEAETEEWRLRCDMAAVFRISARHGWNEQIGNHNSLMLPQARPDDPPLFIINPRGFRFEELTASSLIVCDLDGRVVRGNGELRKVAFHIHARIHLRNPAAACVLHVHPRYLTALSMLENPNSPWRITTTSRSTTVW